MALKFYISDLILSGPGKNDASLKFEKGLNVITGASDTGKSFVFNCLDFMMGASNPPIDIDEMEGYDTGYLVIHTKENITYTIKRSFLKSLTPFFIKKGGFLEVGTFEKYAPKLTNDPNNISSFYLRLIGLDNEVKLKKNQRNTTHNLSFRDIAGLFMIDEKSVISESSPVFASANPLYAPKEMSLFNFLLTGIDGSSLIEIEDNKVRKSRIEGQIEIIEGIIKQKEIQLNEFEDIKDINREHEINLKYESLNLDYISTMEQIDNHRNVRSEYYSEKIEIESKYLFNSELLDRFKLLKDHYISDICRLDFIVEGNHLFDQLNVVNCPICGSEISEGIHEHFIENKTTDGKFEIAIQAELDKLKLKQLDLDNTVQKIEKENIKLEFSLKQLDERIENVDKILHASLQPVSETLKERLQEISYLNNKFNELGLVRQDISHLSSKIQELILLKSKKPKVVDNEDLDYSQYFIDFTNVLKEILISWKFEDVTSVIFDTDSKIYDVFINSRRRGSRGKGFRALTYTAFLYALLKYNLENLDSHPGILIVDSPLTTFKDKDLSTKQIEENELPVGIEFSFFNSFIQSEIEQQVIIFENKEPAIELIDKMNYIHFSKEKTIGRYGFFEPL